MVTINNVALSELSSFCRDFCDQGLCQLPDGTMPCGEDGWHWSYGGHWGEASHDAQFCINGLFFPDRTPHPSAFECKQVMQPVTAEFSKLMQVNENTYQIEWEFGSRFEFIDLGCVGYTCKVELDGQIIAEQTEIVPCLQLAPSIQVVLCPEQLATVNRCKAFELGGEVIVTISVVLTQPTSWAEVGHEVTWLQFPIVSEQEYIAPLLAATTAGPIEMVEAGGLLSVSTRAFSIHFCLGTGLLTSFRHSDSECSVVSPGAGPVVNLFRAPTDNDNGSMATVFDPLAVKWWMRAGVKLMQMAGLLPPSVASDWRREGLDNLVQKRVLVKFHPISSGFQWNEVAVAVVCVKYVLQGRAVEIPCQIDYMIMQDKVAMVHRVDVGRVQCRVPRIGTVLTVPQRYGQLTYFGRAGETYCDRKQAGLISLHTLPVENTHVDYIVPSENGNKHETRWFALQDENGAGIAMVADGGTLLDFSCHHYTISDLDGAQEARQLPRRNEITVTCDHKHMGVGGDVAFEHSTTQLIEYLVAHNSELFLAF